MAGTASRESVPGPPFSAGTAAMGSAAEPEPAPATSDEVSTAPAATCGAAVPACDPSDETFAPAALGFAASESTDGPPSEPARESAANAAAFACTFANESARACSLFEIV